MKNFTYIFLWGCLLRSLVITAYAQKLPGTQTVSLIAPSNLKIDGVSVDWGDKYQAYNNKIETFYSVANDKDNLYLVIHASKPRVIEKILEGGVSIILNRTGKKKDHLKAEVLFPLIPMPLAKGAIVAAGRSLTGATFSATGDNLTDALNAQAGDKAANSLKKANDLLMKNSKEFKISGMDGITDTIAGVNAESPYYRSLPLRLHPFKMIPIANSYGLKAMVQFDDKAELTYEMQIPLKYISSVMSDGQSFFYNITIHGRGEDARVGNTQFYQRNSSGVGQMSDLDLEEPTDLWGEYTLAKKP